MSFLVEYLLYAAITHIYTVTLEMLLKKMPKLTTATYHLGTDQDTAQREGNILSE